MGSRATIPIHPPAVITGYESGSATSDFADGVARRVEFVSASSTIFMWAPTATARVRIAAKKVFIAGSLISAKKGCFGVQLNFGRRSGRSR